MVVANNSTSPRVHWTIFFGLFAGLSLAVLIICGALVASPGLSTKGYEETTCYVTNVEQSGYHECSCSSGRGLSCSSKYPCKLISVKYYATNTNNEFSEVHSIIYQDEVVRSLGCSVSPSCCQDRSVNRNRVDELVATYGVVNSAYTCHYDPEKVENVIISRRYTVAGIVASLVVPSILFVIFLAMTCHIYYRKRD